MRVSKNCDREKDDENCDAGPSNLRNEHLKKKHKRDGKSRLGTSRNVQLSAEGATNCVYLRVQKQVNFPSLRSGNFDERKINETLLFEKNEIRMFGKKRRGHT